jgi:NAD(P)-dependent dehydrogenase (short-subunit alcohol dehydrogenase family)
VIVGGNAGLGQIIAIRLVKEEAKLVLLEEKKTNRKNTKSTMELLPNQKDQVKLMEINSYTEKDLQESYATIVKDMGRIDFVVNCIPFNGTQNKQLIDISQQEWDEAMGIAARSVFLSCKYAIQQMLTQDNGEVRGRIVNVSSLYGMIARKGHFSYGVTKSTIVHLTRQIAAEYASQGIICNAVAPGFIDDIISKEDCIPPISHDRIPTGTPGKAMDVANAVVFLTSDETKYIQGINLLVDGGALAT